LHRLLQKFADHRTAKRHGYQTAGTDAHFLSRLLNLIKSPARADSKSTFYIRCGRPLARSQNPERAKYTINYRRIQHITPRNVKIITPEVSAYKACFYHSRTFPGAGHSLSCAHKPLPPPSSSALLEIGLSLTTLVLRRTYVIALVFCNTYNAGALKVFRAGITWLTSRRHNTC
jgi:hypothetical protein